eukprot:12685638-Prorocentrum_lima.AAC.1
MPSREPAASSFAGMSPLLPCAYGDNPRGGGSAAACAAAAAASRATACSAAARAFRAAASTQ